MRCQECKKNEATVKLTQIINNQKVVLSLCQECAERRGFHNPFSGGTFPLGEMLASVTSGIIEKKGSQSNALKCPRCGMLFSEFPKTGRFGCGECYTAFRPQLVQMLTKIHGTTQHKGEMPVPAKIDLATEVRLQKSLEDQLREAVAAEDFEKAAHLRDKIKSAKPEKKK
jgi:protein arginine kinase activator